MFDLVLAHVPPPSLEGQAHSRMLATTLEADPFLGRILTGRITSGVIKPGQPLKALNRDGEVVENFRVQKVLAFRGLERVSVDAGRGGRDRRRRRHERGDRRRYPLRLSVETPLPAQPVDPPTLSMTFRINDGPFAGQEGDKVQSRVILERLMKEAERNIAIKVTTRRTRMPSTLPAAANCSSVF